MTQGAEALTAEDVLRDRRWRDAARIPLVIGVTGHRELRPEDDAALRSRVREVLRGRRRPQTPLVVVSALAEGADQLVAEVALEQGAELVVPLPLEQQEYEQDFSSPCVTDRFRELLGRATTSFVVTGPEGDAATRPDCYARVGRWIVQHSHVLVALWDGEDAEGAGGTGEVVALMRGGINERGNLTDALDMSDAGPVDWIVTPRPGRDAPEHALEAHTLEPRLPFAAGTEPAALDGWNLRGRITLQRLHEFNADLAGCPASAEERAARGIASHTALEGFAVPGPTGVDPLLARRSFADELAVHYQRRRQRALTQITALSVLAVACFSVFDAEPRTPSVALAWMVAYSSCALAALVTYFVAFFGRVERRHLDYRALAEGLRVQQAWRAAGLATTVADHYTLKQVTDTAWVRTACLVTQGLVEARAGSEARRRPLDAAALRRAQHAWVDDQAGWFRKRAREMGDQVDRLRQWFWLFLVVGAGTGVTIFLLVVASGGTSRPPNALILMASAFALATGLAGWVEKRALAEQRSQYVWSAGLFSLGSQRIEAHLDAGRLDEAADELRQLGREAIEEGCIWLVHRRARPLSLPIGGS